MTVCCGYKVLVLAPRLGKSHFLYMASFVRALLDRGHEVTFITIHSLNHLKLTNYTEILIDPPAKGPPQSECSDDFYLNPRMWFIQLWIINGVVQLFRTNSWNGLEAARFHQSKRWAVVQVFWTNTLFKAQMFKDSLIAQDSISM